MKKRVFQKPIIMLSVLVQTLCYAQEATEEEEKPPMARVSLMAYAFKPQTEFKVATEDQVKALVDKLGEFDSNGESVADRYRGAAIIQTPKKDTLPPPSLQMPLTKEQQEKGLSPDSIPIGFNGVGGGQDILANRSIPLKKNGEEDTYVQIPSLEPDTDNLLLLIPRGEAPTYWSEKPRVIHYNFSTEKYVGKNFVFKNLTRTKATVELHDQKVTIDAGKTHTFEGLPTGKRVLYRVSTNNGKSVINFTRVILYEERLLIQMMMPQHKEIKKGPPYRLTRFVINHPTIPKPKEVEEEAAISGT